MSDTPTCIFLGVTPPTTPTVAAPVVVRFQMWRTQYSAK